jgi:thiamine pyrophosphokinase
MPHVAVVIGGGPLDPRGVASLPDDVVVIAADSGLDHAVEAGLAPTMLVGDLDSISPRGRMWAYAHEVEIREVSADKDQTDTELALACALEVPGAQYLTVLGGMGDRLDHLLGTLLALGHPSLGELLEISVSIGSTRCAVVHHHRNRILKLGEGRTFSVLALHGPVDSVTVRGAKWELSSDALMGTESRGVSNVAEDDTVRIGVLRGVATVVVPG